MSLSKAERDALPASDFAVPDKRVLPIHDSRHVSMAWSQVGRTQGLTDEERAEARRRIIHRAHELGMDTSDWDTIKAMRLEAMALSLPDVADHPNRMPFSGVLVKLDQPSDAAPHGSKGKRVLMSKAAAEKALASLLGMGVDFTPEFDGHDPVRKFGVITAATIEGLDLNIEGFIYAADFPKEAATVKADKNVLGFSFEAQQIHVESLDADPLVITDCVFTGAAILRKDKAAFTTTSLAAAAAGDFDMTKEELETILAGALKPVTEQIAKLEAGQAKLEEGIQAGKELHAKVAPFADKLRSAASGMQAAGIGVHASRGHVAVLNRMADNMEAEAMAGSLPHIFRDHDYFPSAYASADKDEKKPAEDPSIKALKDELASLQTKLTDAVKAAADKPAAQPVRQTLSPQITSLLAKASLTAPEGDNKLTVTAVDQALAKSNLDVRTRLQLKTELSRAGLLDEAA